jgi:hypothetical protein
MRQRFLFHDLDDILLGIPARSMPFIASDTDSIHTPVMSEQLLIRSIIASFQQILIEFTNIVLLVICAVLSLMVTPSCIQFLLAVPIFLFIYSFIVHFIYARLMANKFDQIESSQSFIDMNTSWHITLAMALFDHYTKYVGNLFGGTQWLVIVLRRFGTHIGDDVIIDDMKSLYDVHLITIGSHARLSSTCQIQVEPLVDYLLISLFSLNSATHSRSVTLNFVPSQLVHAVFSSRCHSYYPALLLSATIT